jgi:hypothetical protein
VGKNDIIGARERKNDPVVIKMRYKIERGRLKLS